VMDLGGSLTYQLVAAFSRDMMNLWVGGLGGCLCCIGDLTFDCLG
jgi:hypothetical protein